MDRLADATLRRLQEAAEAPDLRDTRYRLLERIGRGGMGSVYLAEDTSLGRRVALKVLRLAGSSTDLAERLQREARILASLEHPGIVPVHDLGALPDGRVFYTMKYVRGQRLDENARATPELNARLRAFVRICETVASAHSRGVLHRDLKPSNVMVGEFGEVLVMDWGLAKSREEPISARREEAAALDDAAPDPDARTVARQTAQGTVLGTPGYMSPEQAHGEVDRLAPTTDVYSLGAILYFLVSLEEPSSTETPQPLDPRRRDPRVDRRLAAICRRATDPDPARRYAGATDLGADVSRWLEHAPVLAYPENVWERALRFARRYDFVIILILAYMLMRALVAFLPDL